MPVVATLARQGGAALAALALAPLGGAALLLRPAWREGVGERLGWHTPRARGAVWVHGASVGEVLAATRLLDALRERGRLVMASTTTATGRAVLGRTRPDVARTLSPLDHPWCADLALTRAAPSALVLVETELWPTWIGAAARRGIPVAVVSGRISERSFPSYRRLGAVFRRAFANLAAVGARSGLDAERFAALGVERDRISVTGDLKLEPPASPPVLASDLEHLLGGAPFWVAASTRSGEEEAVAAAHAEAQKAGLPSALVLAPRHLDHVEDLELLLLSHGLAVRRRSRTGRAPLAPGEVLILDTLGELPAVFSRARFAFVGGTLAPTGGHNVLEPAYAGRAVLFGPHVEKVREASALLLECGGAQGVAHAGELTRAVGDWLRDPEGVAERGATALRALARHRGATERSLVLVERVLEASA
jgi:3-deoxy-D-manno-octulosonic-acid transferase